MSTGCFFTALLIKQNKCIEKNALKNCSETKICFFYDIHLLCFISNAAKNQPVDIFENFEGVAQALLDFSHKNQDPCCLD